MNRPLALCALMLGLAALLLPGAALAAGTIAPAGTPTIATGGATSSTATAPTGAATVPTTSTPTVASPAVITGKVVTHRAGAGSSISDGAILAAVLGGLLLLAALAWAAFRYGAYEPHWLLTLRHAIAEASFRVSATWAELGDWIRLGH